MEMTRIGIIGLGRMGRTMAARLASQGLAVTGWSRSGMPGDLAASGVQAAPDIATLTAGSDIILLALLDDAAVDAVVGTLESLDLSGRLIVDTSTVSPLTLAAHRPAIEAVGGRLLDAPISGGPEMLSAGKAGFYVGGAAEDHARLVPVLDHLSDRIHHVGALGHGAVAKLMNNMMLSGMWQSLKEALQLGARAGLDRQKMIDVLSGSPAASPAMKGRLPVVLGETDHVGFPVSGVVKDISVVHEFAGRIDAEIPAMKAALASFKAATEAGLANADLATMVRRALEDATAAYESGAGAQPAPSSASSPIPATGSKAASTTIESSKPRITILYCTQCNWLLRSGWMAQELLQTFGDQLGEVGLIPGTGGVFEIRIDGKIIWERKQDGGFPGPKDLKQRVRDVIDPDRDLGHLDRHAAKIEAKLEGSGTG